MSIAKRPFRVLVLVAFVAALASSSAHAHGVADGDKTFLESTSGRHIVPFVYLGAKHMVTGYDHLLFLVGVIFFLYRMRDVTVYVSLFAIGHSATLLFGVLSGTDVNPFLVDAVIGLSVAYKALDNLGAYQAWFGVQPNTKLAVFLFGLVHGFGLATKLQDFDLSRDGLVPNIVAFNVGVEIGQLLALTFVLIAMGAWRKTLGFRQHSFAANVALLTAGFVLFGYQLAGYVQ